MFQKQYFSVLGETGFETVDIFFIKENKTTIYSTIRWKDFALCVRHRCHRCIHKTRVNRIAYYITRELRRPANQGETKSQTSCQSIASKQPLASPGTRELSLTCPAVSPLFVRRPNNVVVVVSVVPISEILL